MKSVLLTILLLCLSCSCDTVPKDVKYWETKFNLVPSTTSDVCLYSSFADERPALFDAASNLGWKLTIVDKTTICFTRSKTTCEK